MDFFISGGDHSVFVTKSYLGVEEVFIKQLCQHIVGMGPTALDNEDDKENSLLHQAFLLDEEKKVSEVLESSGVKIIDFVRAEVGRSD